MNITIDTINRTITVNATVNIKELLDGLTDLKLDFEKYSIIVFNPIMYYPTIPYYDGSSPTYNPPVFYTTTTRT